jgi:DNA-binding GntR family transcriptional regulator
VVRKNLADHAYEQLHSAITEGRLQPGERLSDAALAAQLSISRAPVREAITRLETVGLVVSRGRGWSVIELRDRDLEEIYTYRASLEAFAAERAAQNATDEDVAFLESLVTGSAAVFPRELRVRPPVDMSFHEAVLHVARHERLARAWRQSLDQVTLVARMTMRLLYAKLPEGDVLHRPILNAIGEHDAVTAASEARRHVMEVYELLRERRRESQT